MSEKVPTSPVPDLLSGAGYLRRKRHDNESRSLEPGAGGRSDSRRAIRKFGRSIPEASRLCSRTPARILGLSCKGTIGPGMDADLIVLDRDLELHSVIMAGEATRP
ncbi:MAG TPA: amidohydrolase family protein [Spirochaetia bacterium]|nr:amidohydrolase family protein [Spirochaetia bacterium]